MKRRTSLIFFLCFCIAVGAARPGYGGLITPGRHWIQNRFSDFMDIFSLGVGLTTENKSSGWIPPALGIYLEATPALNLGAILHNGVTAEWEGRGMGAYKESRLLYGIGPYRGWRIHQGEQLVNFYKNSLESLVWRNRMENELGSKPRVAQAIGTASDQPWEVPELEPAKQVLHKDEYLHQQWFGKPRGWQSWLYIGAEVGVCDPFFTHHGATVRAGFDLSEVADFLFGFVCYDFKQDDRRNDE